MPNNQSVPEERDDSTGTGMVSGEANQNRYARKPMRAEAPCMSTG